MRYLVEKNADHIANGEQTFVDSCGGDGGAVLACVQPACSTAYSLPTKKCYQEALLKEECMRGV
jgi:hypothetical protein